MVLVKTEISQYHLRVRKHALSLQSSDVLGAEIQTFPIDRGFCSNVTWYALKCLSEWIAGLRFRKTSQNTSSGIARTTSSTGRELNSEKAGIASSPITIFMVMTAGFHAFHGIQEMFHFK